MDVELPPNEDLRADAALERWLKGMAETGMTFTRADAYHAFMGGYRARRSIAAKDAYEINPDWLDITRDEIELSWKRAERAFDAALRAYGTNRELRRQIADLRDMVQQIREGVNPDEAPLYSRIGKQRNEIRRLIKENQQLRGQIQEIESE